MTYRLVCTNISYRRVIHLRTEVWQMSNEKIKPVLNGTAETMLQCFYARAMHSRNPKNKFHDAKSEELVERLDYDFSNAKKDTAMSGGIVARSVVFEKA